MCFQCLCGMILQIYLFFSVIAILESKILDNSRFCVLYSWEKTCRRFSMVLFVAINSPEAHDKADAGKSQQLMADGGQPAATDEYAAKAMKKLTRLRECEVHSTVILGEQDAATTKRLGMRVTCTPKYQSKNLFHR